MPATNTRARYGTVTKTLHWLTALMILTLIPTGIIANQIAHGPNPLNAATLFSVHKTLGIALFAVALIRILWAVSQPKCDPLHPDRRALVTASNEIGVNPIIVQRILRSALAPEQYEPFFKDIAQQID